VTAKVIGRDDVSGVDGVRLSTDGSNWSRTSALDPAAGSEATSIQWNLSDAAYGGTASDGTKTVYAQFHDRSGKWGPSQTDTIVLDRGGATSPYARTVLTDSPAGYWRLGETSGTTALDVAGNNSGTYRGGPQLGAGSLLAAEGGNPAVSLDGVDDLVDIPVSSALGPTLKVSVEAWVEPGTLPAAGSRAWSSP
jgi:hypothetical protein